VICLISEYILKNRIVGKELPQQAGKFMSRLVKAVPVSIRNHTPYTETG